MCAYTIRFYFGIAFIVLYLMYDAKILCYLLTFQVLFYSYFFVLCVLTLCSHTIKKCKQMLCVRTQRVKFIPDM